MVEEHIHDLQERKATIQAPYHFLGSGLSNVYLVGIKYRVCSSCGAKIAEIPAVKQLMKLIARTIVENEGALSGEEIRFLRKRLGKKSSDFAALIGVGLEEVSRWENGHVGPSKSADKFIRVVYAMLSGDRHLRKRVNDSFEESIKVVPIAQPSPRIRARLQINHRWKTEAVATVA